MFKQAVFIFFVSLLILNAEPNNPKGNIKGKVVDLETQSPLIGANILINETAIGTTTNEIGEYFFENLKTGTYAISFSYLGYESSTKTDVIVKSDRTIFLNVELKSSSLEIEVSILNPVSCDVDRWNNELAIEVPTPQKSAPRATPATILVRDQGFGFFCKGLTTPCSGLEERSGPVRRKLGRGKVPPRSAGSQAMSSGGGSPEAGVR